MIEETAYTHITRIIYEDPRTEEYRQKYQDAVDEIQRLNRAIDELSEKLHYADLANGFLSEMVDNLTDEVNALYVKLHNFNQ
jgi:predicted nuclease with TOPRIM domain